jgi:hypothetical protein
MGKQRSPSQHPLVHELASHTHRFELQCWPGEHAGPAPQPQAPLAEHASDSVTSHATQLAPAMPQLPIARSRQLAPSQHPDGQELSSQMQSPATHRCPATHAVPSPHAHAPSGPQRSARIASHTRQTDPATPHALADCGKQEAPEQQPFGQLAASQPEQLPARHVSPVGHDEHASPALPHAAASFPGRQLLPSQHPDAHEVASHTHALPSQRWPAAQLGPPPQPCVQLERPLGSGMHVHPGSTVQSGAQPSPGASFPSSQASSDSTAWPSPQIAGAPRCTASTVIVPATTRTEPTPDDTIAPVAIPSTRAVKVLSAVLASRSTTMLSPSIASACGGSGRRMGANATSGVLPASPIVPATES